MSVRRITLWLTTAAVALAACTVTQAQAHHYTVTISTTPELTKPAAPRSPHPTLRPPTTAPTSTPPVSPSPEPPHQPPTSNPAMELSSLVVDPGIAPIPYDRQKDFGGWIDADHDCQDTRAEVLITESQIPVQYSDARHCRVTAGRWTDEYTGQVITNARALDIDHVVPLEAAWRSGAWQWTQAQRTSYANDLQDPEHLLAVSASANRSKGSQGPDSWQPPLRSDGCRYATAWVDIKTRWHLSVTAHEESALTTMLRTC